MASSQQSTPEEQCELDLAPEPTCMELLEQVRAETNLVLGNEDGEAGDAATEQDQRVFDEGEIQDSHLDVPDRDVLEMLLSNTEPKEPFRVESPKKKIHKDLDKNHLPTSLLECVQMEGDLINNLFRLAVWLRSAPGGADTFLIRNAKACRSRSKNLNWHQFHGLQSSWVFFLFTNSFSHKAQQALLARFQNPNRGALQNEHM